MLAAAALDFGFPRRTVGRGLDLELRAGEVACLLGPHGSGKTTLLRTLLGLLPPLGGTVHLDGRPLGEWGARERARRLAYVPQAAESYFDFTVAEMVAMGRSAHRGALASPSAADANAAAASLARLGIAHLAGQPIQRVSGGERQLALIARALATGARLLVMDEPTANLDFGNQSLVLEEIARLRASGVGVLLSTHHPEHALRIADRALLLREGRIIAAGAAAEVLTSEGLTALYGSPVAVAEVLLPGTPPRSIRIAAGLPRPS